MSTEATMQNPMRGMLILILARGPGGKRGGDPVGAGPPFRPAALALRLNADDRAAVEAALAPNTRFSYWWAVV